MFIIVIVEIIIFIKFNNIFINIIMGCIDVILIIATLSVIKYKYYLRTVIPDIHGNLKRNYDYMILGNRNIDIDVSKNSLDLRNYKRNIYTDILVMERFYSFLKKNAEIKFYIDRNDEKVFHEKRISKFDYEFLHRVTLMEHNISQVSFKYKIYKIIVAIKFLFVNKNFVKRKSTLKALNKIDNQVEQYVKSFCEKRNLNYKFIILE